MLLAGEICHEKKGNPYEDAKDAKAGWEHGKPMDVRPDMWSIVGNMLLSDDAKIVHRSHCPECHKRPLVFAGKRKAAISSTAPAILDSKRIGQADLEELLLRQRETMEVEERIAVALANGAHVEDGVHTAELVLARDESGHVFSKVGDPMSNSRGGIVVEQKKKPSVFIAILCLDERDGWLAPSMAQFLASISNYAKERAVRLQLSANVKPVDWARNCIVRDFLASGFEWLLMIDNDMGPPPNLLDMVDRAERRMDILVPKFYRIADHEAIQALQLQTGAGLQLLLCWQCFASGLGRNEWCEIAWSGAGVMFVHRRVFEGLGNTPWFRFAQDDYGKTMNSEDVVFCQKARKAGFTVWGNQQFEADHYKTVPLSRIARGVKVGLTNLLPGELGLELLGSRGL